MGVKGGIPPVKGGVQCPAREDEHPAQAKRRAGCEFTVEGIKSCDFPVVQSIIMFYAGAVVVVNLLVDIMYSLVDPRIVYK